ncbi:hypothetical protein [Burkholderia sp. BCC0419]|uniref:hypothetical protein n=1 Tax=Burkholderia sp. BCC0419 TaxID=486878 RepID=UPI00158DE5D9|nr:hypothetical protein [Burkholderia sp. BCC0419]
MHDSSFIDCHGSVAMDKWMKLSTSIPVWISILNDFKTPGSASTMRAAERPRRRPVTAYLDQQVITPWLGRTPGNPSVLLPRSSPSRATRSAIPGRLLAHGFMPGSGQA